MASENVQQNHTSSTHQLETPLRSHPSHCKQLQLHTPTPISNSSRLSESNLKYTAHQIVEFMKEPRNGSTYKPSAEHSNESCGSTTRTKTGVKHEGYMDSTVLGKNNRKGKEPVAQVTLSEMVCIYKRFMSFHPKTFCGTRNSYEAYEWINGVEIILDVCDVPEDYMVQFAAYLFRFEAMIWWEAQKNSKGSDIASNISWKDFQNMFLDHLGFSVEKGRITRNFSSFEQEQLAYGEYDKKHISIPHIMPGLVQNSEDRIRRNLSWLSLEYQKIVETPNLRDAGEGGAGDTAGLM